MPKVDALIAMIHNIYNDNNNIYIIFNALTKTTKLDFISNYLTKGLPEHFQRMDS